MKLFIAISALLAVASAGNLGLSAYNYPGLVHAQHIPVIGANGVPVDEPAVAIAKAEHAAAHVEATARNGDFAHVAVSPYAYGAHVAAPFAVAGPAVYGSYYGSHYAGPQHIPVIGANGVPVDEPAVSVARAHHAAAHVEAKVRNGDAAIFAGPVAAYAAHVAAPVAAHAVPLDTPEVAAAKAAHYAAHVDAKVRNGDFHHYAPLVHYRKRRGLFHGHSAAPFAGHFAAPFAAYASRVAHYAGAQHIPVIGANGVPVDEPAVAIAKAGHAAAHVEAVARNGDFAHVGVAPVAAYAAYAAPVAHYAGPQHIPVIGANGVPVDEPAVSVARAEHAVAHVEAAARNGDFAHVGVAPIAAYASHVASVAHYAGPQHIPVIGANGVPVDEPAVSVARAHHAAAHVEAQVRNGDAAVFAGPVAYGAGHIAGSVAHFAGSHYAGAQHIPVIGANGVPVDEPAVSAARAHHAAAHVEAKVRNGDAAVFAGPLAYAGGHIAGPVSHFAGVHYAGAQHVPVIGANGVPVDEPAVAVAKAHHAAAHVEAKVRNGDLHHFVAPVVQAW